MTTTTTTTKKATITKVLELFSAVSQTGVLTIPGNASVFCLYVLHLGQRTAHVHYSVSSFQMKARGCCKAFLKTLSHSWLQSYNPKATKATLKATKKTAGKAVYNYA